MTDEKKYDVAFSFLAEDEALAAQLNDLLQDRLRTFLYSKRQGEIAGTDGEKTFNLVFGEQSRLVVVLYRAAWGQTPWTRIEETAIRNRAFEHGYDFVKFIPLDDVPVVPKWLPRTQLWLGLKRWGVVGAAGVIEARVQELGGEPREETVAERAARLERALQFEGRRKNFLNSDKGVGAANGEFERLRALLEQQVASANQAARSISLRLKTAPHLILVLGCWHVGLSVMWEYQYVNTLDGSQLEVTLWNGHPPFPGVMSVEKPKKLQTARFGFDLGPNEESCWVAKDAERRAYTTDELAIFILKHYMDCAAHSQ